MTFEITIWKFVIGFSIFREEEPQEIESSVFYKLYTDENGETIKVPVLKPLVAWFIICTWIAPITEHAYAIGVY